MGTIYEDTNPYRLNLSLHHPVYWYKDGSIKPYIQRSEYANTANSATKATQDGDGSTISTTYLKLAGGKMTGGLEIAGHIANDASTTGHGFASGGGYHGAYNNIVLHGDDTTGSSGIVFVSDKGTTNINQPTDRGFIQFHAHGITTAAAETSNPTLATSGEANKLVIGVGNDANDEVWIQTPATYGLKHISGTTTYTIPSINSVISTANHPVISTDGQGVYTHNTSVTMNGGTITATTFSGALSGNASTATAFSSNASITLTGDTTGTASSTKGWSIATITSKIAGLGRKTTTATMNVNPSVDTGNSRLTWYLSDSSSRANDASNSPSFDAGIINLPWDWGGYNGQIAVANTGTTSNTRMQIRSASSIDNGDSANPKYSPNYFAWREVVTATRDTQIGNATQPVYVNNIGQIVAGTALGASAYHPDTYFVKTSGDTITGSLNVENGITTDVGYFGDILVSGAGRFANGMYGDLTGNADTATKLASTPNNTTTFLRGDNTWSSTLSGSLTISKAGECGVEVINRQSTNPNHVAFIVGSSGNGGIYSSTHSKWVVYSDASGNVVLNGNANTATSATSAGYATKSGASTIWLYPENNNELNIGGTNTSTIIYFGYRTKDSRPVPTKFVFGESTGTADLQAKTVYLGSGTSSYVSSTNYTGTAAKATADGNGATISSTYAKLSGATFTGAVTGTSFGASSYLACNTGQSSTTGGLALWGTGPSTYGIAMRGTGDSGKHGYVQGDWAIYSYMSGTASNHSTRGWILKDVYSATNVMSVSCEGNAVFNGSVTIGGNTTNTSGCRQEYDADLKCLNFVFN